MIPFDLSVSSNWTIYSALVGSVSPNSFSTCTAIIGPSGYWNGAANFATSVIYSDHKTCQDVALVRDGALLLVIQAGNPPAAVYIRIVSKLISIITIKLTSLGLQAFDRGEK